MEALRPLENKLANLFKGAPKLSNQTKESLANFWPWLALVAGLLQLLAAYWLWQAARVVDVFSDYVNTLSVSLTGQSAGLSSMDKTVIYVGVVMLAVDALLMLMAYPELKKRTKRGWDLLFLAAVINVAYAVLQLFTYSRGFGSFLGGLIGSAIGFYLLFQVREKYKA